QHELVLGKHSGRHALRARLSALGYTSLDRGHLDRSYAAFVALADRRKAITDADLHACVRHAAAPALEAAS
ncbi:MAG: 2-isopropylmalate synthase, partial [Terriglobales bacterium]